MKKVLLLLLIIISSCLFADSEQVIVKGEYLKYYDDQIIASRNVIILYKQYAVRADQMVIDTKFNKLFAQGNVVVGVGESKKVSGQGLIFDLKTDNFEIVESSSLLNFQGSKQDVFLQAKKMKISATDNILDRSLFTTCALEDPHYWLSARKVIYIPDQEIIFYHLTVNFCFSPLPIYLPYYKFSLGSRKVYTKVPIVGFNSREGRYIKTETVYFWDEQTEGGLLLDGLSQKGSGRGFWSKYQIKGLTGYLYGYGVEDRFDNYKNNYIYKINQELYKTDNSLLKINYKRKDSYVLPFGNENSEGSSLFFKKQERQSSSYFNYAVEENLLQLSRKSYLKGKISTPTVNSSLDWQENDYKSNDNQKLAVKYNQKINDSWQFDVNPYYYRQSKSALAEDRLLKLESSIRYQGKDALESLRIYANFQYAPNNYQYLEKVPEITATFRSWPIYLSGQYLFSWKNSLQVAEIRESKYFRNYNKSRNFQSQKYLISNQLYRDFFLEEIFSQLHFSRTYDQILYGSQDQNYLITDSSILSTTLGSFITHTYTYKFNDGKGASPFFFDDPQKVCIQKLWSELNFHYKNNFRLKLSTGKDFLTGIFDDYLAHLRLSSKYEKFSLDLSSGWNRYSEQYRDLVAKLSARSGDRFNLAASLVKDINYGQIKNGYSQLNLMVGENHDEDQSHWDFWTSRWLFSIKNSYDFRTNNYNLVSFILGKDLHCWSMKYYFTPIRKEWFIQFSLKALPEEPVRIKGAEDKELSLEAFQSVLDNDLNRFGDQR